VFDSYPDLDEGVRLTKVPSLDLYREPDPFRVPKLREFRDRIDVEEFLTMCTAGFPEPKTFGSRISRLMRERAGDFDIAHDTQAQQSLAWARGLVVLNPLGLRHLPAEHQHKARVILQSTAQRKTLLKLLQKIYL
jgi:hypothetical protein